MLDLMLLISTVNVSYPEVVFVVGILIVGPPFQLQLLKLKVILLPEPALPVSMLICNWSVPASWLMSIGLAE